MHIEREDDYAAKFFLSISIKKLGLLFMYHVILLYSTLILQFIFAIVLLTKYPRNQATAHFCTGKESYNDSCYILTFCYIDRVSTICYHKQEMP